MPFRSLGKQYKALLIGLLLGVLITRIISTAAGYAFFYARLANAVAITLSIVYYFLLAAFCFCTGKIKNSAYVLSVVFSVEIILLVLVRFLTTVRWIRMFVHNCHIAVRSSISRLEDVFFEYDCYTFPDWVYVGSVALVYLLMIAINLVGKRCLKERKENT